MLFLLIKNFIHIVYLITLFFYIYIYYNNLFIKNIYKQLMIILYIFYCRIIQII